MQSPIRHPHLPCLLTAGLLLATAFPASAQISKAESGCRGAISKATAKYMKAFGKAVVGCHVARDSDASMSATDCNDIAQADPGGKVQKVRDSALAGIEDKCEGATTVLSQYLRCPAPFATIDDLGDTNGIDDFTELANCLLEQAESVATRAASSVMGSPVPPLSASLAACHKTLGSAYAKLIDTTIKVRNGCQKTADKTASSLGFVCATADPKGKIAAAEAKAKAAIVKDCSAAVGALRGRRSTALEELGSCADTAEALAECVVDEQVEVAAGGAAAMAFELPGTCPGSGGLGVSAASGGTQMDVGSNGLAHDMEPIVGYRAVGFPITCDADCNNCTPSSAPVINPEACRCTDNAATVCATNSECSGQCACFFGPPTAYTAGGVPACVTSKINGALSGSYDAGNGDIQLDFPMIGTIFSGESIAHPCPRCIDGTCDAGQRGGMACSVDGHDATFGDVSYDCPPSLGLSIGGLSTVLHYTSGPASIPFSTPCDLPNATYDCACAACSGNTSLGCASNADCAPAYGTCTASSGQRRPNNCGDGICSVDPADATEGSCASDAPFKFCDRLLRANGKGLIPCSNDASCNAYVSGSPDPADWVCPDDDCGQCTVMEQRECFLDPIVATGSPGETIVGVGCFGMSANPSVNTTLGLPGPYRVRQNLAAQTLCPDGVTPFYPPGGSNCPD